MVKSSSLLNWQQELGKACEFFFFFANLISAHTEVVATFDKRLYWERSLHWSRSYKLEVYSFRLQVPLGFW